MKSCLKSEDSLIKLFGYACKSIMGDRKFLTNDEYKKHRGEFSKLSGLMHNVRKNIINE